VSAVVRVKNQSVRKRVVRCDVLERIAEKVCAAEGIDDSVEVSLLLCDDEDMRRLNRTYRDQDRPTDVLAFAQDGPAAGPVRILGDIVISLETVEARCRRDQSAMRKEVRLLFCHGLLHLLGYDHATERSRMRMAAKQAASLGLPVAEVWPVLSGRGLDRRGASRQEV